MSDSLHREIVVVDGLTVCNWGPDMFRRMHAAGLTATNSTCSLPYRRMGETLRDIAQWKIWFVRHADILIQVRTTADILRAKREGKLGIILGFQDSSHFDDYLPYIAVLKELGISVVQLTYNTANAVGSGCFESHDGGLTDFGREFLAEMNRTGIVCDLSHVGARTANDAIEASTKPVTYSHISPAARLNHPRNKSDEQMRRIAERGGHIGVTMHPPFQPRGDHATLDDYVDSIEHCIAAAGEDHIGIGTDFIQGYAPGSPTWDYLLRDKGHARKLTTIDTCVYPPDFSGVQDYPNLTACMICHKWPEKRIRKVMGENWLRFLKDVWGA